MSLRSTPPAMVVGLAGNPNAGKSVMFNRLTGSSQTIGNWPGTTVERCEGWCTYRGRRVRLLDLPGVYSLGAYTLEEDIAREQLIGGGLDVVIDVVDATSLERNLYLTLEMLDAGVPLVVALNKMDALRGRGGVLDLRVLRRGLGVPVVPTVAREGAGLERLLRVCCSPSPSRGRAPVYCGALEEEVETLAGHISRSGAGMPGRWGALRALEGDRQVITTVGRSIPGFGKMAERARTRLRERCGLEPALLIRKERYRVAARLARRACCREGHAGKGMTALEGLATHRIWGNVLVMFVLVGLLVWTFAVGTYLSGVLESAFSLLSPLDPAVQGPLTDVLWNGAFGGLVAGVTLVLPYVIPFYLMLAVLEDSGYLARISFMMDRWMRAMGLHGKAVIPLILGYGCSVPACLSCRIMETPRQRFLAAFAVTLVPCTARTVVILGLVAAFVNIWWALALYLFDIVLILVLGRVALRILPGDSVGMVMEMPPFQRPSGTTVLRQTWARTRSLMLLVFPVYILGSALLQAGYLLGWLAPLNDALSPVTVQVLGLPAITGVLLIFGIVRKELTLLMLATLFQTLDFALVLTPVQMVVLALVTMIYTPCISTILVLAREFGWRRAAYITAAEIGLALLVGGIAFRVLSGVVSFQGIQNMF